MVSADAKRAVGLSCLIEALGVALFAGAVCPIGHETNVAEIAVGRVAISAILGAGLAFVVL